MIYFAITVDGFGLFIESTLVIYDNINHQILYFTLCFLTILCHESTLY
jgi:hypothetical protein